MRGMGLLLAITTLLVWALQKHAAAQTAACPPYTTPVTLNFTTENAATRYNNDLNVTGIQTVMRRNGFTLAGSHQRALGLTSSQLGFGISGETYAVPVSGGYCVYAKSITANFGYRVMDVYIASEYRPQTCEYRVVMDHENQHVAINKNTVKEYAPRVRQELEKNLRALKPRFTADAQVSSDRKIEQLHEALNPLMDEMERALERRNATIDTSVNYEAIGEMCKNWDKGNVWPVVNTPAAQN